jgi:putative ABC transport system substrate-binding protein
MTVRRRFLSATLALTASTVAGAQVFRARTYRVVGLSNSSPEAAKEYIEALEEGFRDLGYSVGRNLIIEHRYTAGHPERLDNLAAEIVQSRPDVIIAVSNAETAAAMRATRTIPIVIALGAAPDEAGIVASLARPGGNVTGHSTGAGPGILAKWLELLVEVLPGLKRAGMLWDSTVPGFKAFVGVLKDASSRFGVELRSVEVRTAAEFDGAFARVLAERVEALCVVANVLTFTFRGRIAAFAAEQRLPAISYMREFVEAGLLMSYGVDLVQLYRRAAVYADKLLKGARPGDLPVEQASRYELVVNLAAARKIGLKIPQTLLIRADRVIE